MLKCDLIRFGHFANREIEFSLKSPDYHIVYGDNEAGNSTLLKGISALFFGVPSRTPDVRQAVDLGLRILLCQRSADGLQALHDRE